MFRTFIIAIIFLISTGSVSAQYRRNKDTKPGFLAGFVYTKVDGVNTETKYEDYGAGGYVGAFVDIYISDKIHLQPGANFGYVNDYSILYFPLMLKYLIGDRGFNVQAGTQVTYLLGANKETKDQFGWELGAGLGMDITKSFFIQGRYTYEVSRRKVDDFLNQPNQDFKFNNIMIGIGYRLSPVDRL